MNRKSRITKAIKYFNQRNVLFWILTEELKLNQSKIVKLCRKYDFKIDQSSISKIILEKKKELLEEEVLREEEEAKDNPESEFSAKKPPNLAVLRGR